MDTIEEYIESMIDEFNSSIENVSINAEEYIIKYEKYLEEHRTDYSQEYIRKILVDKINEVVKNA